MALNQFIQTPEKGLLTDSTNDVSNFARNAIVVSTETGTIVPGTAVVLSDTVSDEIVVAQAAASTNPIVGFVPYSVSRNEYTGNDSVKYATRGAVIYLEAGAAISRGANVEYVPTGQKVVTRTTGTIVGRALDKAAADGDLIRIELTA